MSPPEKDRTPTGGDDPPGGRAAADAGPAGAKRAWGPPTVTTFKVTDTQGIFFGSADGINNLTNT
jgi:hypothetical protein